MKKTVGFFALALFVLFTVAGLNFGQTADLTGTWIGQTEVPDAIEPDGFTMVISQENGVYSITVSDSMGLASNAPCKDIEFTEGKLTFSFEVDTGEEYLRIWANLTVNGDTMTGHWESEEGSSGSLEMKKK